MADGEIKPGELLAALGAFAVDREIQTQGKAIRVLITDMLTQLGYLRKAPEAEKRSED
jgi:hypothetical protein